MNFPSSPILTGDARVPGSVHEDQERPSKRRRVETRRDGEDGTGTDEIEGSQLGSSTLVQSTAEDDSESQVGSTNSLKSSPLGLDKPRPKFRKMSIFKSKSKSKLKSAIRSMSKKKKKKSEKPKEQYVDPVARIVQQLRDGTTSTDNLEPRNLVSRAYDKGNRRSKYYKSLDELSKEKWALKLSSEDIASLRESAEQAPNYLGRTASLYRGIKHDRYHSPSNGHTTHDLFLPAAAVDEGEACHSHISDLTRGQATYMVSNHLMWMDMNGDELLSHSQDGLFLVIHALNRANQNQGCVTIQFWDTRKATASDKKPIDVTYALTMYDMFDCYKWSGWDGIHLGKLKPRKFTQEWLTHGPILLNNGRLKPARLEDLVRDGLYEIFPHFRIPSGAERSGLYEGQVYCRKKGYPPADRRHGIYSYEQCAAVTPMTDELLATVRKCTRNFMQISKDIDTETVEPALHIFVTFLTFQKRVTEDPKFMAWIRDHYTAADVLDVVNDDSGKVKKGFTRVADNLPGVMQYLDLMRDACKVFNLPPLPDNMVETQNLSTGLPYKTEDGRLSAYAKAFSIRDEAAIKANREKKREKRKRAKSGSNAVNNAEIHSDASEESTSATTGDTEPPSVTDDDPSATLTDDDATDGILADMPASDDDLEVADLVLSKTGPRGDVQSLLTAVP